jgi:hypothetical protein
MEKIESMKVCTRNAPSEKKMKSYEVPLLILTFNRPSLVELQLLRLKKIKPRKIYIASDGPRSGRVDDQEKINRCRDSIERIIDWECEVKKKYETKNLGCGVGVSTAISWFFDNEECGIILEDDCQVSNSFFDFCAELLIKYKDDTDVAGISADFKFLKNDLPEGGYGFIDFPQIWGWATWRRVWSSYDFELSTWSQSDALWLNSFPMSSKRYWIDNFNKIANRAVDTWDYQFAHHVLSNNLRFIHPMRNMVTNVGFGADATHTKSTYDDTANLASYEIIGPYTLVANYNEYNNYLKYKYFVKKNLIARISNKLFMYSKNILIKSRSQQNAN